MLEQQLKNTPKGNTATEPAETKVTHDERHRYLAEIERLRLKSDEELLARKDFERRYNEALKEKTLLLERIDKLQGILH